MFDTLKALTALALILTAAPSLAQDTTTDAPATEEVTETEVPATEPAADPEAPATEGAEPAPGDDLALGTPVDPDAPQIGQPYIREVFGDWSLRCLRAEEGQAEPCELYQLLNGPDGNPVAEISVFPLPPGGQAVAGATIVAPLETLLTEQLTISVDGTAARRYPFSFCNRAGCLARIGFTQEEVDQFKAGNVAQLRLVPAVAPDQDMVLDISLTGFTAGIESGGEVPAE
jgi:invasion protein IalB